MKIKMKENCDLIWIRRNPYCAIHWQWCTVLALVSGMTLEVETKFLFKDQYNTAPLALEEIQPAVDAYLSEYPYRVHEVNKAVESITGSGLRIMDDYVSEVLDDERKGKGRCSWCGNTTNSTTCEHCGKSEYVQMFTAKEK